MVKKFNGLVMFVKKVDVCDLVKVNYFISYGVRLRFSLKVMVSELLGFGLWKLKRQICLRDLVRRVFDEEVIKFLFIDVYVFYEFGFKMFI